MKEIGSVKVKFEEYDGEKRVKCECRRKREEEVNSLYNTSNLVECLACMLWNQGVCLIESPSETDGDESGVVLGVRKVEWLEYWREKTKGIVLFGDDEDEGSERNEEEYFKFDKDIMESFRERIIERYNRER